MVIEQAFGRLKGVWRRLKYLNISNLSNSKYIITCACILHNIGIKSNIEYDQSENEEDDDEQPFIENLPVGASGKRNFIMSRIH